MSLLRSWGSYFARIRRCLVDRSFLTENAWSMRELLSALRRMKVNKAADEVGLVVELLQHAPSSFLQELLRFYNHVLHTGDVPTSWRKTVFRMLAKFISKASV